MGFNITGLSTKINALVSEHSASILTAVGMTGAITTAILTGRASFKAAEILHNREMEPWVRLKSREEGEGEAEEEWDDVTIVEKIKMIWPLYIPVVASGVTTVTSIFFAHQIATKKTAALAAAYGLSEKAFQEYKDKVVEKFGDKKETDVRDELAKDRMKNNPVDGRQVIIVGTGDVLCYDSLSGRYFQSSMEGIKKAENSVNHDIIHHMYASLSKFYDEIGLPPTSFSDTVGWNSDNIINLTYSTQIATDGRPCLVIDFNVPPVNDYGKLY